MRDLFGFGTAALIALASLALQPWSLAWWIGMALAAALVVLSGGDLLYRRFLSWQVRQHLKPVRQTPIWKAVAHIRDAINDTSHGECYPETLKAIRQAALDGKIKLRGRPEINTDGPQKFSDVSSDIPPEYWRVSLIGAMATDERCYGVGYPHTNPETVYAWGQKGVYEKKRYSDLTVNMQEIKREWPSET